jgi:hypothetical protein
MLYAASSFVVSEHEKIFPLSSTPRAPQRLLSMTTRGFCSAAPVGKLLREAHSVNQHGTTEQLFGRIVAFVIICF